MTLTPPQMHRLLLLIANADSLQRDKIINVCLDKQPSPRTRLLQQLINKQKEGEYVKVLEKVFGAEALERAIREGDIYVAGDKAFPL